MDKCKSCGAELLSLAHFCGTCGAALQPNEGNELFNIQTVLSNPSRENTPPSVPATPPLPQQNREVPQYGQGEPRPNINSSTEQPNNLPSGPHPQPPTFHGDDQQPYSNYQQPLSPPYGNYQTPLSPLPPYGNYQRPQHPVIHTTQTVANADTTGTPPIILGPQRKPPFLNKGLIIAIIAVVILASTGGLGLIFLKPQPPTPTISMTSDYRDSGKIAGSGSSTTDGTIFRVTGQNFATNSSITFLLNDTTINKDTQTVSDGNGNFSESLKVTSDWHIGQHTLTARDASNNKTDTGVPLIICEQGDCGTPGPNGAPTNTATFTITVHVSKDNIDSPETLTINSQGKPAVCSSRDDGSQQLFSPTSPNSNITKVKNYSTYACSGTYKAARSPTQKH
jgi:hypothetical protein